MIDDELYIIPGIGLWVKSKGKYFSISKPYRSRTEINSLSGVKVVTVSDLLMMLNNLYVTNVKSDFFIGDVTVGRDDRETFAKMFKEVLKNA
jgi:hypothetical protein